MLFLRLILLLSLSLAPSDGFCGENRRMYRNFEMNNVYGLWFGVGHAQHTPDLTNKPNVIGCVTVYISDVTNQVREDWVGMDNSIQRRNWTNPSWRSQYSNPWSDTPLSGSWLDYRMQRMKRDVSYYGDKRLWVVWDEDGQTEEQSYVYASEKPGLWKLEQWRPGEREMKARGMDIWYSDDQPRRPETIQVLKSTPYLLILHHCSESGGARSFTLVMKRSPTWLSYDDWQDIKKILYSFELPHVYRYTAVCAGCWETCSRWLILACVVIFYGFK